MIHPTIGRQVWFRNGDGMTIYDPAQPCAATVIFVHGDRCVDLDVISHNGVHHRRTSIQLLQDDDPVPVGPHATWPLTR